MTKENDSHILYGDSSSQFWMYDVPGGHVADNIQVPSNSMIPHDK